MEAKYLLKYFLKVTFWSKSLKDEMGWYKSCIKLKNFNLKIIIKDWTKNAKMKFIYISFPRLSKMMSWSYTKKY
jgi:hypothetical protein